MRIWKYLSNFIVAPCSRYSTSNTPLLWHSCFLFFGGGEHFSLLFSIPYFFIWSQVWYGVPKFCHLWQYEQINFCPPIEAFLRIFKRQPFDFFVNIFTLTTRTDFSIMQFIWTQFSQLEFESLQYCMADLWEFPAKSRWIISWATSTTVWLELVYLSSVRRSRTFPRVLRLNIN